MNKGDGNDLGHDDPLAGLSLGRVLLSEDEITRRVAELGATITRDYAGRPRLLVGVLKGAFMFMADLARVIQLPVEMDFMAVSSYGTATKTSGIVRIVKDLDVDLVDRHVLIVEDIVDSGLTLSYLRKGLSAQNPGESRDLRPSPEDRPATRRPEDPLRRFRDPPRLRRRLRARRCRGLPEPARHSDHERRDLVTGGSPGSSTGVDLERAAAAVRELLAAVGEDPERPGLQETPARVASMLAELLDGMVNPAEAQLEVTFSADHDEMVMVKDIPFASLCEHHLVPFIGVAHVAYIPNVDGRIIGLSKLARLVDNHSHKLQVQERLTTEIADTMERSLKPRGTLVVLEAEHLCMTIRGVRKPGARTVTSAIRGLFRTDVATRAEAMAFVRAEP